MSVSAGDDGVQRGELKVELAHSMYINTLSCRVWLYSKYVMLNICISWTKPLTVLCCPQFLSVAIIVNCTSCKTEHHHLLRGLTATLLVGGLGVEDQQNGLHEVPIWLHVICFGGQAKEEVYWSKKEHLMNWNCKVEILCWCSIWLLKDKCWVCVIQFQHCV